MTKYMKLSLTKRIEIAKFLESCGEKVPEGYIYKSGWSDPKVAERFKATPAGVRNVRMELFGTIVSPKKPEAKSAEVPTIKDIAALDDKIRGVAGLVADLGREVHKLKGELTTVAGHARAATARAAEFHNRLTDLERGTRRPRLRAVK